MLVLTPLPKYPELLSAYREPEFRLTFWATMVALTMSVIFAFFGGRLPDRVEASLWIVIGIAAALFAPWMFGRAMPDIDRLYHYFDRLGHRGSRNRRSAGGADRRHHADKKKAGPLEEPRFLLKTYFFSSVIITDVLSLLVSAVITICTVRPSLV